METKLPSKKKQFPHKLHSTYEAVQAAASLHLVHSPTVLWADMDHRAEFLGDGENFDPSTLFLILPLQKMEPWPRKVAKLNAILGSHIVARRATYIPRVPAKQGLQDVTQIVNGPIAPTMSEWGYSILRDGQGRLPFGMAWMLTCRGRGQEVTEKTYASVLRMRSHARPRPSKNPDDPDPPARRSKSGSFIAWHWEGSFESDRFPREWGRNLCLSPDIWIRRRPIRRAAGVVSISIFGLSVKSRQLYDMTPAVANACYEPWETLPGHDLRNEQWRRALFMVDRGDGVEWIAPMPSRAQPEEPISREEAQRLGVPQRAGYCGSPLLQLREALKDMIGSAPRLHWIREDKAVRGEDPIQ